MEDADGKTTGQFGYFGIAAGLKASLYTPVHPHLGTIELKFHIDGIAPYLSSTKGL